MIQYDEYDAKPTGKVKVEAFEEGKDTYNKGEGAPADSCA